jgi:O-antigen ligase
MHQYDWASFLEHKGPVVVHNIFLLIAAETGIIGLATFVWFLVSVLVQACRLVNRAPNGTIWMVGVATFAAYVAFSIHGLVDFALLWDPTLFTQFWLLAGLAAGLSKGPGIEKRFAGQIPARG